MKKLLILSVAIFCFYGCKSTSSDELGFSSPNTTRSSNSSIPKSVYTEITRSLDPLGLIWDSICNKNETIPEIMSVAYTEVKRDPNDKFIESFFHDVTLENYGDHIEYTHSFDEGTYLNPNITDSDFFTFYTKEKNITYSHSGNNKRFFGNPNKLKNETFTEFCKRYEDEYTNEVESNYKVIEQNYASGKGRHSIKIGVRTHIHKTTTIVPFDTVELKGINKKVGESIKVDIISEGALKGLSRETIEKDSNGVSIKTIDSYYL